MEDLKEQTTPRQAQSTTDVQDALQQKSLSPACAGVEALFCPSVNAASLPGRVQRAVRAGPLPGGAGGSLTEPHIRRRPPETAEISVILQGDNLRFSDGIYTGQEDLQEEIPAGQVHKFGRRDVIKRFSVDSRRRMIRRASSVRWHGQRGDIKPVHVVLTYPAEFPAARASKRDLKVFLQALVHRYPEVAGLWKLEPQEREAPHYHLVLLFCAGDTFAELRDFMEDLESWGGRAWFDIVDSGDSRHLRHGFWAEYLDRKPGYLCKALYATKAQDTPAWHEPGRYWGVLQAGILLGMVETTCYLVSRAEGDQLRRYLRRKMVADVKFKARVMMKDPEKRPRSLRLMKGLRAWKRAGSRGGTWHTFNREAWDQHADWPVSTVAEILLRFIGCDMGEFDWRGGFL